MLRVVYYYIIISIAVVHVATAQISKNEVTILDEYTNPGGMLDELKAPPPKTEGTTYIFEEWVDGVIYFKNGQQLMGFDLNYDLNNNIIEINSTDGIKVCPLALVHSIEFKPDINQTLEYLNLNTLASEYDNLPTGIGHVLVDNKVKLVEYPYLYTKEPSYVPQLDMGYKNKKVLVKKKKYLITPDRVSEVPTTKNKLLKLFLDKQLLAEEYVKKNQLNIKRNEDLIKLIKYYNSII